LPGSGLASSVTPTVFMAAANDAKGTDSRTVLVTVWSFPSTVPRAVTVTVSEPPEALLGTCTLNRAMACRLRGIDLNVVAVSGVTFHPAVKPQIVEGK